MDKAQRAARTKRLNKIILVVAAAIILPYAVYVGRLMHRVSSVSGNIYTDGPLLSSIRRHAIRTRPSTVLSKTKANVHFTAAFVDDKDVVKPPKTTLSAILRVEKLRMGAFTSPDPNKYIVSISGVTHQEEDGFVLPSGKAKCESYRGETGSQYYDSYPPHWISVVWNKLTPKDGRRTGKGGWFGPERGRKIQGDWVSINPIPDYQYDYFSEGAWKATYAYYDKPVVIKYLEVNVLYKGQKQFEGLCPQRTCN